MPALLTCSCGVRFYECSVPCNPCATRLCHCCSAEHAMESCGRCGVRVLRREIRTIRSRRYCLACSSRLCTSCGTYSERWLTGSRICATCSGARINQYNYAPVYREQYHTGDRPGRFEPLALLGLEIEVEFPLSNPAIDYVSLLNIDSKVWYWKHDGSLRNGAEAVSMPMSWSTATNGALVWTDRARFAKASAWKTDTCGLHVHISRKVFSGLTLYKLLTMFERFPKWVSKFSQRKPDKLKLWAAPKVWTDPKPAFKVKHGFHEKYRALNLKHANSIECRIFHGTLRRQSILVAAGWFLGLVYFAKDTSIRGMSPVNYTAWLKTKGVSILGGKFARKIAERNQKCVG